MSEFVAMNAPDPLQWTLNSCFVLFRSVWGAFGSILLLYDTRFKTGRTVELNAKVQDTKLR